MPLDINCDMGELEDAAHEAALMEYITSANIACGGHAGDDHIMERTTRIALDRGVRIGAHPGYPDRANFGRIEIAMNPAEIAATVHQQIARLIVSVSREVDQLSCERWPHLNTFRPAARSIESVNRQIDGFSCVRG